MTEEQSRNPKQAANQRPPMAGDSFDAGSFVDLIGRALHATGAGETPRCGASN